MNAPEIHITVDSEGNVVVTTKGYKGKSCLAASRFLEEALGAAVARTPTPEYHAVGLRMPQKVAR